jgi:hypothetical protein
MMGKQLATMVLAAIRFADAITRLLMRMIAADVCAQTVGNNPDH